MKTKGQTVDGVTEWIFSDFKGTAEARLYVKDGMVLTMVASSSLSSINTRYLSVTTKGHASFRKLYYGPFVIYKMAISPGMQWRIDKPFFIDAKAFKRAREIKYAPVSSNQYQ